MAGSVMAETRSLHVPAAYGEPPDGWTWSRLDDVSEGVFDCPHSTPKLTDSGPFVVRTQDIITGVFRADQAGRVSEETYAERIARVTPSRGDLLYSREGTYFGIAAEVPPKTRVCLGQRMVLIRPDKRRLDFSFLCHWLNSPIMAAHIHGYRDGTVAERLNLPTIRALPILIPPLAEQKAIAAVLGALDDKIELNRRMNATLEAMARALFQSWFVDFDPVRAKLDGRPPAALDPATAALFPEHLEDSPLGHIPKGWEVVSLEALVSIRGGKQLPTEDCLPAGKFTVFGANGIMGYATESTHEGFVIAFGRVGAYCGSIHWSLDGAWINNNASAVVPLQWPAFVLQTMLNIDFNSMRTGSAQPFIPNSSLASAKVLRPSPEIAEAFSRIVEPWRRQQANNDQESRTLATLRDTLLPKLLSGELSVREANTEKEVAL